ncbi:MAG: hypothetical protein J0I06_13270 [Planctomycetes bacterium]|nr:hypothetical protein [Planctomycetota bacterium]
MSRVASAFVLVLFGQVAAAADLPPGALARLGDDRFRAGGAIEHLAISPDGKQFATTQSSGRATLILTVWDAVTGQPIRGQEINEELFKGFVWGHRGGFAIVIRAEPGAQHRPAKVFPDDFRVWEFTDPKAQAPSVLPAQRVGLTGFVGVEAERPKDGPEYTDFQICADATHIAAKRSDGAVHVFELKPTDTAAKLARIGGINLGAEGADNVRISAGGKTVVTFRELVNPNAREQTATAWDVATGKPMKPVRVPRTDRLVVTPDARSLVAFVAEPEAWGFDHYDLATGQRRQLTRWKYGPTRDSPPVDWGGFAFAPSGRELVITSERKTHVIDLMSGAERGRLEGHANRADAFDGSGFAVAMSADGTRIATADRDGLVRLWDAKTLRAANEAAGHRAPVEHVELSPDGRRLLTWAPDRTVRLWDVTTGKELRALIGTRGHDKPTFTPDGTAILYSTDERLIARDLQTGLEIPLPGGMKELAPRTAVFAPDGKAVLTWFVSNPDVNEKSCEVWTWPTGKKLASWNSGSAEFAPGFSSDGSLMFDRPTSPNRWDAKTGKELPPAWEDDRTVTVIASLRPHPRWLIHDTEDASHVIEAGTGKPVSRFQLPANFGQTEPVLSPTGSQFAALLSQAEQVSEDLLRSLAVGEFVLLSLRTGDAVRLCETGRGVRRELRGHRGEVRVLGFTPDGSKLLTAGGDHTVLVWDMRLQSVALPDDLKNETDAAKLWGMLATDNAKNAYLAMARLAREPDAAVKLAKMKLKPAAKGGHETDATKLADARAIELLESLESEGARAFLKELAAGDASAFRTREAKRALERNKR